MASQTLAEAGKLTNDEIVEGVAQDIIDINPIFSLIPFDGHTGQSITSNRENALGDAQKLAVGGTITAKAAATFTSHAWPTDLNHPFYRNGYSNSAMATKSQSPILKKVNSPEISGRHRDKSQIPFQKIQSQT